VSRLSWRNPPAAAVIGGTEHFLVSRGIRKASLITERSGRRVVRAETDAEAVDAMTMATTFGDACLILIPLTEVSVETVQEIAANQPDKTGLLIHHDAVLDEKKHPVLSEIHAAYQDEYNTPKSKKGQVDLAIKFARAEADSLLGEKKSLDPKLADALISRTGTDLGIVAFEIAKMATLARAENSTTITVDHVRQLLRTSSGIDMEPVRAALRARNATQMAAALDRVRRLAPSDPVMLLLRARGGPADLAMTWLQASILLERGVSVKEVASRIGVPEWATKRDVIPAVRRWGTSSLRALVRDLSRVERGVLQGSPSPWVSCESALLLGCSG
jgi:DNA polymerase III delta subunit